jgi:hypothetical protein
MSALTTSAQKPTRRVGSPAPAANRERAGRTRPPALTAGQDQRGALGAFGFLPLSFGLGYIVVNGLPPGWRGAFSVGDAGGAGGGVVAGAVVVVVVVVVVVDVSGALFSLPPQPASQTIAERAIPPATIGRRPLNREFMLQSHLSRAANPPKITWADTEV